MTDEQYRGLWLSIDADLEAAEVDLDARRHQLRRLRAIVWWSIENPGEVHPVSVLNLDEHVAALVRAEREPIRRHWAAVREHVRSMLAHYRSHAAVVILGRRRR